MSTKIRSSIQLVVLVLLFCASKCHGQSPSGHCAVRRVLIGEEKSDAKFGMFLSVHRAGSRGIFGCSHVNVRSLEILKSTKWIVDTLNGNFSQGTVLQTNSSYIPGVRVGFEVFDSCEHPILATQQLTQFMPILESGNQSSCSLTESSILSRLGVVDGTGMTDDASISMTLRDLSVPRIGIDQKLLVSASSLAMNFATIIKKLKWTNLVLVNADDEYSIRVVKILGQLLSKLNVCISSSNVIPSIIGDPTDQKLRDYRTVVKSLSKLRPENLGIIFIGHGRTSQYFLEAISESLSATRRHQWFFSSVINPKTLEAMPGIIDLINDSKLYSLAPHPAILAPFEDEWKNLGRGTPEPLVAEYKDLRTDCMQNLTGSRCTDYIFADSVLESMVRTSNVLPSMRAVLHFFGALRSAWRTKCKEVPGTCSELVEMTYREFVEDHLHPQSNNHLTDFAFVDQIFDAKMALTTYSYSKQNGFSYNQAIVVMDGKIIETDPEARFPLSSCEDGRCRGCVSVRQSRLLASNKFHENWVYPNDYDVLIPLLIPLHETGDDPKECGSKINPIAFQTLESLIWTIDRINNETNHPSNVKIGVLALDTCSSTLKTAEKISEIYRGRLMVEGRLIDPDSILSFITTTAPDHETAVSMLAPLNVSTVSIVPVHIPLGQKYFNYQVPIPASIVAQTVINLLASREWKFVTLVSSFLESQLDSPEYFRQFSGPHGICLADDVVLPSTQVAPKLRTQAFDDVVFKLMEAKNHGSNFVVLWTSISDTVELFTAVRRAVNAGKISNNEFNWIGTQYWGQNFNVVQGFEDVAGGAIVVTPATGDDLEFMAHFTSLGDPNTVKNPWLEEFLSQMYKPGDSPGQLPLLVYHKTLDVPSTIQAAWSIVSGFRHLRNVVCKETQGFCGTLYSHPDIKYLMNRYLQYTPSTSYGENFHFIEEGFGSTPVLFWNLVFGPKRWSYKMLKPGQDNQLVIYENSMQISAAQVTSECRFECRSCTKRPQNIFIESPNDLYIAAVFPVHSQDRKTLQCGRIEIADGIQNLEAFLWAVDIINRSTKLLPWIKLGAIVLDSCSSKEKTVRDVYNLFASPEELGFEVQPHQITGVIAGSTSAEVKAVLSITEELGVTTITPDVKSRDLDPHKNLIRLSQPNKNRAKAIASILDHFKWTYASVVYLTGNTEEFDIYRHLLTVADEFGIQFGLQEGLLESSDGQQSMTEVIKSLLEKKAEGSNIVVLILPPKLLHSFFQATEQVQTGDLLWVIMDEKANINDLPPVGLGSIIIRPNFAHILKFSQFFRNLKFENNTRDVWFREYMQGPGRFTHNRLNHGESVVNTINAVYALAQALDKTRASLCPKNFHGLCDAMKTSHPALRKDIHKYVLSADFWGSDTRPVRLSPDGQGTGQFQILNYQKIGQSHASFVEVGEFNNDDGLNLTSSSVFGYDSNFKQVQISNFASKCSVKRCHASQIKQQTASLSTPSNFIISGLLPVHRNNKDFFKCGPFNGNGIFQNLLALNFAVNRINGNATLLPNLNLGVMLLDYCGRPERAQKDLFTYFAHEMGGNTSKLVASVAFERQVASAVEPILQANHIFQVVNPISFINEVDTRFETAHYLPPQNYAAYKIAAEVLRRYSWKYISVVSSDTTLGSKHLRAFQEAVNEVGVCVTNDLTLNHQAEMLNALKKDRNVVVLMVQTWEEARMFLDHVSKAGLSGRFQLVLVGKWATDDMLGLGGAIEGSLVINMNTFKVPGFGRYYQALTMARHEPIPDDWFEEFWQDVFDCQFPYRNPSDNKSPKKECSGEESLGDIPFLQDDRVYYTVEVVNGVAEVLHKFLTEKCGWKSGKQSLKDCEGGSYEELQTMLRVALSNRRSILESSFGVFNIQLLKTGRYQLKQVGSFEKDLLVFNKNQVMLKTVPQSGCTDQCNFCSKQISKHQQSSQVSNQELNEKFTSVWGLIVTSFSLLGILLVIICIIYFLLAFPITTGTTVLGYLILVGVMLLLGSNFAFIVGPTLYACGVRKVLMSVAYSMIFSGMLIKAFNTWRMTGGNDSDMKYKTSMTKPFGLLIIALGLILIQVVLVVTWMVLKPPYVEIISEHRYCVPASNFEEQLVVSLSYCGVLLMLTLFFSGISWSRKENHRESRWIFSCCTIIMVTWIVWMVSVTQFPHAMKDPTIVIANIICATTVMLLLYLRKVYLYSKISKQVKDFEFTTTHLKAHQHGSSAYGTCRRPSGIHMMSEFIRGSRVSVSSDFTFEGPPNSTMTEVTSEGMSTRSSTGSTQVQGADLYPLEVYDGGSQFQPHNLSTNSRRALVGDNVKNTD